MQPNRKRHKKEQLLTSNDISLPLILNNTEEFPVVPRRERVWIFCKFLLNTFSTIVRSGPVLDVAGGKGDLSWLLLNHDGVDSCVVDPRRTDHTKLERQAQWCMDNPKSAAEQILTTGQLMPQLALTPPFRTPKHLRLFVDASLLEVLLSKKHDTQQQRWEQFWNDASARAEAEDTGTKLHHQPKPKLKPSKQIKSTTAKVALNQIAARVNTEAGRVLNAAEAHSLLTSASLLCGFHPDEATDSLVDLALAFRVPFALVPCCWFPKTNPDRRIQKNTTQVHVRTYNDYVQFLCQKHPNIRVERLPFRSEAKGNGAGLTRNVVVYMLPSDFDE